MSALSARIRDPQVTAYFAELGIPLAGANRWLVAVCEFAVVRSFSGACSPVGDLVWIAVAGPGLLWCHWRGVRAARAARTREAV